MNEDTPDQKQSEGSQGPIQQQQHSQQSTPPSMIEHGQHLIHPPGAQMHPQQRDEASLMQEYAHQQYEASKLAHHPHQHDHPHPQQNPDNLMLPKVDPDHGMYYDQMGAGPSGGQHMYQLPHHMGMADMGEGGELAVMRGGFGRPRLHPLKQTGMSRPRGRPKGSKNKRPRKRIERPPKRPRGRPRKWPPEMYEGFNRSQDAHIRQLQQQNMITGIPMGIGMQGPSSSGSDEMMMAMSTSQQGIPMLPCCQPSSVMGGRLAQNVDTTCDIFPPTGMPHPMHQHHLHPGAPGQQPTEFLRQYMPHIDVDSNVAMMMQMQHQGGVQHQNEPIQHRASTSMHPSPSPSSMGPFEPPPSSSTGPQQHNVAVTEHEQHMLWLQQQQQQQAEMQQQHHMQQTPHTTS